MYFIVYISCTSRRMVRGFPSSPIARRNLCHFWLMYLLGMHEPKVYLVPLCAWHLPTTSSQLSFSIKAVNYCSEYPTYLFDFLGRDLPFVTKAKYSFWVIIAKLS